jgi:aminoglycoside phosphotransferase (APT) family kinase protein
LGTNNPWLETANTGAYNEWWYGSFARKLCDKEMSIAYKRDIIDMTEYPMERLWRGLYRCMALNDVEPRTLCHGDTHIGNTYHLPDGRAGLFDWQSARRASWAQDVCYYLATSLTTEDRRESEVDLLRMYLGELTARGVAAPDWDDAWLLYRQNAIWGVFMWVSTPSSIHRQEIVETTVRRCWTQTLDLNTLELLHV